MGGGWAAGKPAGLGSTGGGGGRLNRLARDGVERIDISNIGSLQVRNWFSLLFFLFMIRMSL